MNWKYILKLNPDNLSEDDKDQLLSTIAWFDCEEELEPEKFIALLKISQEIMKYKAEQVEALLAELDEIAARQGEEEARKHDTHEDSQSLRSKHTGSTISVDYEHKYRDLKVKLKQQLKLSENQREEIKKLKQNVSEIKTENVHLQNEIQSILNNEEGKSETSESITDQHKELVHIVQQKNSHISQLLNDIETIETENQTLRDEVTNLRDKLSDATTHLSIMTNDLTTFKVKLSEKSDTINNLTEEKEALKSQIQDFVEEKQQREIQIDEFAEAIDVRVDKWKKILEEKDEEIQKLKNSVLHSSGSNISCEKLQMESLSKLVLDQEVQLSNLQTQLQNATKEMHKSTNLIEQLSASRNSASVHMEEQAQIIKNLKNQLQSAHKRSQELQDSVVYAESIAESKQDDINELITKLKADGKVQLAESVEEMQKFKLQLRVKDKQIRDYVRISNNLQNALDELENENTALRDKCGIPEEEQVSTATVLLKKHKQKQELVKLRKQVQVIDNENLELKEKVLRLKRQENLQDQPDIATISTTNIQEQNELVEENEALRKGLHEILASIQLKKDRSAHEIKSETLEKLLKTLDVRHVSGWYHPAMRLQAELHASQGVNNELREQLRHLRLELSSQQTATAKNVPAAVLDDDKLVAPQTVDHIISKEEETTKDRNIESAETADKVFENSELLNLHKSEKKSWEEKESSYQKQIEMLEDKTAILDAQLSEFSNLGEDDYKKAERFAQMSENLIILNRKCVFLENQENKLLAAIKNSVNDKTEAETKLLEEIATLRSEKTSLLTKIGTLQNVLSNSIDCDIHTKVQKNLDSLTLTYRNLLEQFESLKGGIMSEATILNESVNTLEAQKLELYNRLIDTNTKQNMHELIAAPNDTEELCKRLAQIEANELTEKQRANHMSNLFNVVKEQLQKSEERCTDLEKNNQDIKHANLGMQTNLKTLEDKLINYVDKTTYQSAQAKLITLTEKIQEVTSENEKLRGELIISKKNVMKQIYSGPSNDMEILNLKHQILDLQASSDDKALIARLSSDVVLARLSETQCQQKLNDLEMELNESLHKCKTSNGKIDELKEELDGVIIEYMQKINTLEDILKNQRQQYLGSMPFILQETFNIYCQQILKDKRSTFTALQTVLQKENECTILQEQLNKQREITEDFKEKCCGSESILEKLKAWHQECNAIYAKEIRNRRELEFKKIQLEQLSHQISTQDELLSKLQEELLQSYQYSERFTIIDQVEIPQNNVVTKLQPILTKQQETQTTPDTLETFTNVESTANLQDKHNNYLLQIQEKDANLEQLKSKITEMEMNLSLFRTQIGDKQSQINFYEKHILELQNKISKVSSETAVVHSEDVGLQQHNFEEILSLKDTLKNFQESSVQKDASILKYQTLLKKDRDEHSLAAARVQQELKRLQDIISTQENLYKELQETSIKHPGKAAIEQYINQVHALEQHTDELHTNVSSLTSQLQASRQETARWQTLANERLNCMDELRAELEDQHQAEILVYKQDSERWRDEITKLKQMISKHRSESGYIEPDLKLLLNDKDEKIRELSMSVKYAKNELNRINSEKSHSPSPKLTEIESNHEQLNKELQTLKKQYEQLINRERNAKDEVLKLKEQLLKKPISARSDKTEKEHQLQKKITSLEKEIAELKDKLEKQLVINEAHRVTVTEDFEKWKKQKHFQQLSEKLKIKLDEKTDECEKLNQTCTGYKILIERLEREKHSLENKNKILRGSVTNIDTNQLQVLSLENNRLQYELDAINSKLQMQHHHSGGLGAAMLQDKLEAQERKIAILELTSKGTTETRTELERLQNTVSNLQKLNLRLEAENLELKLDMEKLGIDAPHLHDRIHHLESYIEVLKSENQSSHVVMGCGDYADKKPDIKKVSELERTVFVLKRVIEKLQVENKRLQSGSRPCTATDRSVSSEKLYMDYKRLKEQYSESIKKISSLEEQLKSTNNKVKLLEKRPLSVEIDHLSGEVSNLKMELVHKTQLLDKVKVLLHRAATREKTLIDEINSLKLRIPEECCTPNSV